MQLGLTAVGRRKLAELRRLNDQLNRQLRAKFSDMKIDTVLRFLAHIQALSKPH